MGGLGAEIYGRGPPWVFAGCLAEEVHFSPSNFRPRFTERFPHAVADVIGILVMRSANPDDHVEFTESSLNGDGRVSAAACLHTQSSKFLLDMIVPFMAHLVFKLVNFLLQPANIVG